MPMKRGQWEYRGHWIDNNLPGSTNYYVYWADTAGNIRCKPIAVSAER